MSVILVAFNGTTQMGQFLGDTITSIKAAYLCVQNSTASKVVLALSRQGELNFLWRKFIDTFNAEVVYDDFDPGNNDQRYAAWDQWRAEREIDGRKFDVYRELYRRIDGGLRQAKLCGGEKGLGRKNIFEYFYYGQEGKIPPCVGGDSFDDTLIYYKLSPPQRAVFLAPKAKCQGNNKFTFQYWDAVVRKLVASGVSVTVNHDGEFCEDLKGPLYQRIFPAHKDLVDEVCKHKIVVCGNTGIGWVAGATGTPLLAMQPHDSNMQDYRYEWCGVKSLVEFIEQPDADYCVRRILEELEKCTILTTGCFDVLHAGHIRHLDESRSLGTKLVVALNSDASVKRLKGPDRPLHSQEDRKAVLESIRCVDEVVIFDDDNALKVIERLRPKVVTNGCDHKEAEIVGKSFVESYGGRVYVTGGERGPSTTKTLAKLKKTPVDVAAAVQMAAHLSPNPPAKLRFMAEQFLSVIHLPGEVADVGAYKGACSLILRKLGPNKILHVFDTGHGNPHFDPLCHHGKGEWAADFDMLRNTVGADPKTVYHQGIFPASAADVNDRQFCFAYIDVDTYQSTKDALEFFWNRLVPGGKLVVDDVPEHPPCAGVEKAVRAAFQDSQLQMFPDVHGCVVVKG